jgi:RHS repeat-associated protein
VASADSGSTWGFTYNAVGDRAQWAYTGGADQHLFDPSGTWLGNAGSYSLVPFGGRYFALYYGGNTLFNHVNALDSASMRTLQSGAEAEDILFYPWGDVWEVQGSGGYNFAGMPYRDVTTTTDLTTFRVFSPNIGRWHSPDPLGGDVANPQSLNRYPYLLNNPTTLTDPLGLAGCPPGAISIGQGQCAGPPVNPLWRGLQLDLFDLFESWRCDQEGCTEYVEYNGMALARLLATRQQGGPGPSNAAPTPRQAATQYCQQHRQLSFNIPFTSIPVTVSLSATAFLNFSTTNDVSLTFPPSAGVSVDVTVGAPNGPNIPVQVGVGKNASVGTFLTPNGPSGFSFSVPLVAPVGSPVTISPTVGNACGWKAGGG